MPTVAEVLKQSGFSDEEIAKLDGRVSTAFSGVLSSAEAEKKAAADALAKAEETRKAAEAAEVEARKRAEKAELVERSNKEFYDGNIVPALNSWEDRWKQMEIESTKKEAEIAFYKTQLDGAKKSGFITGDIPAFTFTPPATIPGAPQNPAQPRDSQGRYTPGVPGSTPGSPTLIDDVRSALSDTTWTLQQYQKLYGQMYPGDAMEDAREAAALKLPYRDHVSRKYKFNERAQELQLEAQKRHDEEVRSAVAKEYEDKLKQAQETAKADLEKQRREWAERTGSNPDVRSTEPSRMQEVQRAVKEGTRPDPLTLNSRERTKVTRQQINERISADSAA